MSASSTDSVINEILRLTFPMMPIAESLAFMVRNLGVSAPPNEFEVQVQAERERLQSLEPAELQLTLQSLRERAAAAEAARQAASEKRAQDKAAARDAAMFYSQPLASADFVFWSKADFWTLSDAVALLLGKDPRIVTESAVRTAQEGWARAERNRPLPPFLEAFQRLQTLAQRSDALTRSAKLRPADVIQWAERVGMVEVPAELRRHVASLSEPASEAGARPTTTAVAPLGPTIKKSALMARYGAVWATIHSDLGHANDNGLAEAAKAAGHGYWHEDAAIHWAKQNGKIETSAPARLPTLSELPGRTHRVDD